MLPISNTLPDWLQLVLILAPSLSSFCAAIALVMNIMQSRRTNTQVRATLIATALKDFISNADMQKAFYRIEYGIFKYDSNFHNSEEEQQLDKLLQHFATIASLWKSGLLTEKDIAPLHYYFLRIMGNTEILKYLEFMDAWSKAIDSSHHPYSALKEFSNKIIRN